MKMKRNLIILAVVLVLAAGIAIIATRQQKQISEQASASPAPTSEPMNYIHLTEYAAKDMSSITIANENGRYTIYRGEDGLYRLEGNDTQTLNQGQSLSVFNTFSTITAYGVVGTESELNLEEYGLATPKGYLTMVMDDGEEVSAIAGQLSPTGEYCYFMMEGDENVYTIPARFYNYLMYEEFKYYGLREVAIAQDELKHVRLEKNGVLSFDISAVEVSTATSIYGWKMSEPWQNVDIEGETLANFTAGYEKLQLISVVEGVKSDPKFGFDKPRYHIIAESDNVSYDFLIGASDGATGCSYVCFPDEDAVYLVNSTEITFLDVSTYQMFQKQFCLLTIKNVTSYDYKGVHNSIAMNIENSPKLDDEGNQVLDDDGNPKYSQVFKIGSKVQDEEDSRFLYQYMIKLAANGVLEEGYEPQGNPVVTLTFNRNVEPLKMEYKFYDYDLDFYAVSINGNCYVTILKSQLDDIDTAIDQFHAGTIDRPGATYDEENIPLDEYNEKYGK